MKFNLYRNERQRWVGGLLIIFVIYSLYYLLFAETNYFILIPRMLRHVIKFIATVAVYLIGTHHLGKLKDRWMIYLWHLVHISLLVTITLIGFYSWLFSLQNINVIQLAKTFQEFLISPVLYVGMAILNNSLVANKKV